VPCAWLASRGEAERFLYYDGPTYGKTPCVVEKVRGELRFTYQDMFVRYGQGMPVRWSPFQGMEQDASVHALRRRGMFVRVRPGVTEAYTFEVPLASDRLRISEATYREGPAVERTFLKMLTDYGLTAAEARGLLDCWRVQFFKKTGRRVILILTENDYDTLCPIRIRPKPTALVRIGIVLTEF
jgi:hypothetical protein